MQRDVRAGGGAQPVGYVGCIAVSQGRKSGFSPGKADQVWHPSSSSIAAPKRVHTRVFNIACEKVNC